MSDLHLHIVSFDTPYPANYNAMIDVFYTIKSLHRAGVKIHLHCFNENKEEAEVLEVFCQEINYYKKNTSPFKRLSTIPYSVRAHVNKSLVKNLAKDDYPILLEGMQLSYYLNTKELKGRKILIRPHNVDLEYYESIARSATGFSKKMFLKSEARKLKKYESVLEKADHIIAGSKFDDKYFDYKYKKSKLIFPFHPFSKVLIRPGKGKYALFHGNLSEHNDINAALFLIENVFNNFDYPFKIAGLNPDERIKKAIAGKENIELISNPGDRSLFNLIRNAQVNVLYSEFQTGLKIRLLNVLHNGRFCLINDNILTGTPIDDLCITANDAYTMRREIKNISSYRFSEDACMRRKRKLSRTFSSMKGAKELIRLITT